MEWIFEILILGILSPPGGFIRWCIFKNKPLKDYITDDPYLSMFPLVVIALIAIAIHHFI